MLKQLYLCVFILTFTFGTQLFSQNSSPCSQQSEFNQLDFWVGEWKVFNPDGSEAGYNKISKILDNCSVLEEWTGSGVSRGKSLNFYNPQKKIWQQVWIDNFANPLFFNGQAKADSMIYTGTSLTPEGRTIYNKMILSKEDEQKVRQLWSQSRDQGQTWKTVFDGLYIRSF